MKCIYIILAEVPDDSSLDVEWLIANAACNKRALTFKILREIYHMHLCSQSFAKNTNTN